MSVTRTPIRNEFIRRREEIADAKRTSAWIAGLLAFAAFSYVGGILLMAWW